MPFCGWGSPFLCDWRTWRGPPRADVCLKGALTARHAPARKRVYPPELHRGLAYSIPAPTPHDGGHCPRERSITPNVSGLRAGGDPPSSRKKRKRPHLESQQLMPMRTHIDAIDGVDVLNFAQRREEAAAARARQIAKAEMKATATTHRVGQVVVDVGDHEGHDRLEAAYALTYDGRHYIHTTVEEAQKLSVRELQAYLRFHQQEVTKGWLKPKLKGLVMAHIRNTLTGLHEDEQEAGAGASPKLLTSAVEQQGATSELDTGSTPKRRAGVRDWTQPAEQEWPSHQYCSRRGQASQQPCIFPSMGEGALLHRFNMPCDAFRLRRLCLTVRSCSWCLATRPA
ncbi:hypothetical protein HaLaN_26405 [Haematococcus lacustris]|uniref:Uncharacterized protein n=1 Tax=Haematococcus lacustris TaxID=44745 RepID=A0A6A0A656_HAELA|nr:hypothetical protein HaLaN_26405 [Haematococcus lacustris]